MKTKIEVKSTTYGCNLCIPAVFKSLVYEYRKRIDKNSLPEEIKNRKDCHWGKNCKTQSHNLLHCKKFNHVCDQTRF